MGEVGGILEGGGMALLASSPGGVGRSWKGGEVSLIASPAALTEAISEGVGFLLIAFMLVGVGGSRAGQTQAFGNESWKGLLNVDAVTISSAVNEGEGGAREGGLNVNIVAGASLCVSTCKDGRGVWGWGPSNPATLGLHP